MSRVLKPGKALMAWKKNTPRVAADSEARLLCASFTLVLPDSLDNFDLAFQEIVNQIR